MNLIKQKIKENYPSKADFSNEVGISPKDLSSKLNTVQNRIDWLNDFLKPLNLKVEIVETDVSSNGG
jgi:hypothetical protein